MMAYSSALAPTRVAKASQSARPSQHLQRELRDLKQMVDVLGPAALGTQDRPSRVLDEGRQDEATE
jgi:hypothetical protein